MRGLETLWLKTAAAVVVEAVVTEEVVQLEDRAAKEVVVVPRLDLPRDFRSLPKLEARPSPKDSRQEMLRVELPSTPRLQFLQTLRRPRHHGLSPLIPSLGRTRASTSRTTSYGSLYLYFQNLG